MTSKEQARLYRLLQYVAQHLDQLMWKLCPEQHAKHTEAEITRTIAALFPNGVCQNCVHPEHKEGE